MTQNVLMAVPSWGQQRGRGTELGDEGTSGWRVGGEEKLHRRPPSPHQAQQQNGGQSSCRAGQRASRWQMLGVLVRLENRSPTCPPKSPALDSVSLKLRVPLQHPREDSLKHMVFFFLTNAAKSIKKKLFAVNIYLTLNRLLAVQAPK